MPGQHSAGPSALGYQYQTSWCLLELLRSGPERPDAAITLELHDDVAWDTHGSASELLQLKHHLNAAGSLTDQSADIWGTVRAWMDAGDPSDPLGPLLTLVTTSVATPGTAAHALRVDFRDVYAAVGRLRAAAIQSAARDTAVARARFIELGPAGQQAFVSRMRVIDGAETIDNIDQRVRQMLWAVLPVGDAPAETFLALVWRWWSGVALDMLLRRRASVDVGEAHAAIAGLRDAFNADNLPTLVELADVNEDEVVAALGSCIFVQQMSWVEYGPVNLRKAIVDYYRAVTQTTDWLDNDLVGRRELERFEDNLRDEWARAFEDMLEDLALDADDATKVELGKRLLRQLRDSTAIAVRSRYNDPFFARGKRHELADIGQIGWHPEFQQRLEEMLAAST